MINLFSLPKPDLQLHIEHTYTSLNAMDIYKKIEHGIDSIFLDSSKEDSHYSNYSIIGIHPFLSVKYENKTIYVKEFPSETYLSIEERDIFYFLNQLLLIYQIDNPTSLPFIAGGLGYFGYDLSKELEHIPVLPQKNISIPDCYFVFYDNCLILDLASNILTVTGLGVIQDSKKSVNKLIEQLSIPELYTSAFKKHPNSQEQPIMPSLKFTSSFTKESYMLAVEIMRQYIEEGHIYIANMTHTFETHYELPPLLTYEALRSINPAPFSAYLPLEGFEILSSSPERFIDIQHGKVQTRPIKGTSPRGLNPTEDKSNKEHLKNSEKDKSELLMIVDLERNDLSKVCIPGSVKVTELFEIEEYATVFHLVATIEGQLKSTKTSVDCLKAAFPGGSITGAPKIRAMEIIEELESTHRNIYTGSIGYLGFDGNADFNIVIRSILLKDNKAYIGVGGGITWESDPESEYNETLDKANALFKTLNFVAQALTNIKSE